MATPSTSHVPSDPALTGPWENYRTWAATANYHKNALDLLSTWSLLLAIAGAILATLGQQIAPMAPEAGLGWLLFKLPGVLGAAAIALSAYLATQAIAGNREGIWVRCRSAAESLKAAIFLYRASVAPFDGADRASQLRQRAEKLLDDLKTIERRQPQSEPPPILAPLNVDQYITERVDDQVDWYNKRAGEFQRKADLCRYTTAVLGAFSALLTLASAVKNVSSWAAVIATVTAAITAHLQNRRYQMLTAMYQSTALRLTLLKSDWAASGKTDNDKFERDTFIQRCEETMSAENGAWVALWSNKDQNQGGQPPSVPQPTPSEA